MADIILNTPGGDPVSIPEEQAQGALAEGYSVATPEQVAAAQKQAERGSLAESALAGLSSSVLNDPFNPIGQAARSAFDIGNRAGSSTTRGLANRIADLQEQNPIASTAGELAPQLVGAFLTGGTSTGLRGLAAYAGREAAINAAYAVQPELTNAVLRDRDVDGEKLLVGALVGAGLGAGAEVGGAALGRLLLRPGKAGLERAAALTFGEAAPGIGSRAADMLASAQSSLGGVDRAAARRLSVLTAEGRDAGRRAVNFEKLRDDSVRELVDGLEDIRKTHQALRAEWGSVTKRPHIAKHVRRGNEAQTLTAARALLVEGEELAARLAADPLKYGGQEELSALGQWIKRSAAELEAGAADNAVTHSALDQLKKQVDDYITKPLKKKGYDNASMAYKATGGEVAKWRSNIAKVLENEELFGDAGRLQRVMNESFSSAMDGGALGVFDRNFTLKQIPGLDPASARFVDPAKVTAAVNGLTNARKDVAWQGLHSYVDSVVRGADEAAKALDLPPEKLAQFAELRGKAEKMRETIAKAGDEVALGNQLRAMERSEGLASALGGIGVGAVLGGELGGTEGALLGALGGGLAKPASLIRRVAAVSELSAKFDAKTLAKLGRIAKGAARVAKSAPVLGAREAIEAYQRDAEKVRARTPEQAKEDTRLALSQVAGATPNAFAAALEASARKQRYLQSLLPPKAPTGLYPVPEEPSLADVQKWNTVTRALDQPATLLDDAIDGRLSSDAAEAVRTVYPQVYEEMRMGIADTLADLAARGQLLPYNQRAHIGSVFDLPTDPSVDPAAILAAQEAYKNQPLGEPPPPPKPPGGNGSALSEEAMTGSERVTSKE